LCSIAYFLINKYVVQPWGFIFAANRLLNDSYLIDWLSQDRLAIVARLSQEKRDFAAHSRREIPKAV
jgi:hypothetical protein